jgi:acetyl esterase/lipase
MVLAYPVISLGSPFTHTGSREHLLGPTADRALTAALSNERQVTKQTPATFLFHTNDDPGVPVENSIVFYEALRKAGVPAEMHVFATGRHGVGLAPKDPSLSAWPGLCAAWMRGMGFLTRK